MSVIQIYRKPIGLPALPRRDLTKGGPRVIVPLSGGKDSQLCLSVAVEHYGPERVTAVHNHTGIDHSLTYEHMRYLAALHRVPLEFTGNPKYSNVFDLIDKRNMIPGRLVRICTDELKIVAFNQWLDRQPKVPTTVLMGMRAPESVNRMEKYQGFSPDDEFSLRDLFPKKVPKRLEWVKVQLPIVQMSTPSVFVELKLRGEKINPLYARGHKRVGCYPCAIAGARDWVLASRDPEGRAHLSAYQALKARIKASKGFVDDSRLIEHDIPALLAAALNYDPFGFDDLPEDDGEGGCSVCTFT